MYIQRFSISLYYVNKRLVILFIIVSIIIIFIFFSLPPSFSNKNSNNGTLCHIKK
jgi:hypothetical protein